MKLQTETNIQMDLFENTNNNIPSPPNDGIVCFVLRTGFDTIQGQLLRTMAYHAEGGGNNTGGSEGVNSKETFHFLKFPDR